MSTKFKLFVPGIALLLCTALPTWSAEKAQPQFNSIEVTHFTRQEGVELTDEFFEFLYAAMKEELEKSGLFRQVVGEGEVAEASEGGQSLILQGSIVEYKAGSAVKAALIGFGAGKRSLRAQLTARRQGDNSAIFDKALKVSVHPALSPQALAKELAEKFTKELKKGLKG